MKPALNIYHRPSRKSTSGLLSLVATRWRTTGASILAVNLAHRRARLALKPLIPTEDSKSLRKSRWGSVYFQSAKEKTARTGHQTTLPTLIKRRRYTRPMLQQREPKMDRQNPLALRLVAQQMPPDLLSVSSKALTKVEYHPCVA